MSVIAVARDNDGRIFAAADSMVSTGDTITLRRTPPKVFKWGNFIMGGVGDILVPQLIYSHFEPPAMSDYETFQYITGPFIDKLRKLLKDKEVNLEGQDSDGIVCFRKRIFHIGSDFSITEVAEPWTAIGSGQDVALGVLAATRNWKDTARRVREAVRWTSHYITSVGGPITEVSL